MIQLDGRDDRTPPLKMDLMRYIDYGVSPDLSEKNTKSMRHIIAGAERPFLQGTLEDMGCDAKDLGNPHSNFEYISCIDYFR